MAVADGGPLAGHAESARELENDLQELQPVDRCGAWARVPETAQLFVQRARDLDWVASIDSTIMRVHQHGATLPRVSGLG